MWGDSSATRTTTARTTIGRTPRAVGKYQPRSRRKARQDHDLASTGLPNPDPGFTGQVAALTASRCGGDAIEHKLGGPAPAAVTRRRCPSAVPPVTTYKYNYRRHSYTLRRWPNPTQNTPTGYGNGNRPTHPHPSSPTTSSARLPPVNSTNHLPLVTQLEPVWVETMPNFPDILPEQLYISPKYSTAELRCPCRCGGLITLTLSPRKWALRYDGRHVTIEGSILTNLPCNSHFFVEANRIRWA